MGRSLGCDDGAPALSLSLLTNLKSAIVAIPLAWRLEERGSDRELLVIWKRTPRSVKRLFNGTCQVFHDTLKREVFQRHTALAIPSTGQDLQTSASASC